MSKKMNWTFGSFDFSNPVPEEEPKKVKYILNTDFGPIKEGTEMLKSEGIYVLTDKRFGLSVSEEYVTEVTEFEFGDRVVHPDYDVDFLRFISLVDGYAYVIHAGVSNTPFSVNINELAPYND